MIQQIFLFFVLLCSSNVYAQELSMPLLQRGASGAALQQWQNSVDAIRSQVAVLIQKNDELTRAYHQDLEQENTLLNLIEEQRAKIDALNVFLKERAGKTDQQLRIDMLNEQLRMKKLHLNKTLLDYKTQLPSVEAAQKRLEKKRMLVSEYELHQSDKGVKHQDLVKKEDVELVKLQSQVEEQERIEKRLTDQLGVNRVDRDSSEIDQLHQRLIALQSQKEIILKKPATPLGLDKDKYYLMQAKKEELEVKIRSFEKRIDVLRSSSSLSGDLGNGRKEMLHMIVQSDARNKKMLNEIKDLKENIALLKVQIGVLEKRALFSHKK